MAERFDSASKAISDKNPLAWLRFVGQFDDLALPLFDFGGLLDLENWLTEHNDRE